MLKQVFDIIISLVSIIFLSPLFLIIAVLIKLSSAGPVFFKQERVGKNGKKFLIFKFRSMAVNQKKGSLQITVGKDKRITKVGHFLRKYKIDELPQLINVLLGEMSIVGPRPEVEEYVNYYSPENKAIVLSVKPGITDLASINFKNENEILGKEENPHNSYINKILPLKLRYYRFYVKHKSFCLDMYIICKTALAVLKK